MRIAVLGYSGSGKTYISNYISQKQSIPVLHLDAIKYDKEWRPINNELVLPLVSDFLEKDDWIIDGYYKNLLLEERLNKADLLILMQLPRLTCLWSVIKRSKERTREGYVNDLNWWFVKFTLFGCRNKARRNSYAEIAEKYKDKIIVLKTRQQVNKFLFHFGS